MDVKAGTANQVVVRVCLARPKKDFYQVLNVRDGAVVHIQDYRRRREAWKAAGLVS